MGGLQEIFELFDRFNNEKIELNFEKGILQAIGYKEFYGFYKFMKDHRSPLEFNQILEDISILREDDKKLF